MSEDPWYSERRARWKPDQVSLLLVAESAPDDGGDIAKRRFFYDEDLTGRDGLFRQVIYTLLSDAFLTSGAGAETPWLSALKARGVFLIDITGVPVNCASPDAQCRNAQAEPCFDHR